MTANAPGAAGSAAALPPFRERALWWGGDLQTVRNVIAGNRAGRLPAGERVWFAMTDGDRLAGTLHESDGDAARPLAVLVHGLAGCEDSAYLVASTRHLLASGFPVLRLNLRGAGVSRPVCRSGYHAGRSEDFADVLTALPAPLRRHGVVAVAYSLGGNMLLKHLGERGAGSGLTAAVAVSAPLDLAAASRRFRAPRNALYQRWLLGNMKREALAGGALTEDRRAAIVAARTVYDFDDRYVAPRHGFAGADDYYTRCSAARFLAGIATPTLLLHADNDPWIDAAPYRVAAQTGNSALTVEITRGGGHVGFHGPREAAGGHWHDAAVAAFLDASC
jgi:predicted alpha/beta-fold hydrolase